MQRKQQATGMVAGRPVNLMGSLPMLKSELERVGAKGSALPGAKKFAEDSEDTTAPTQAYIRSNKDAKSQDMSRKSRATFHSRINRPGKAVLQPLANQGLVKPSTTNLPHRASNHPQQRRHDYYDSMAPAPRLVGAAGPLFQSS